MTKTYDGTTGLPASGAGYTLSGTVAGDAVTFDPSGVIGSYASPNAAGGIPVYLNGGKITATRNAVPVFGYTVGSLDAAPIGTITPAPLTVSGSKTYDGSASFMTATLSAAGAQNGEIVTLTSGTGLASSANAGSHHGSAMSGLAISVAGGNALASNYLLPAEGTLTVVPALLTVTALDRSKTYGQSLALGTTGFTASGLVPGDTVSGVTLASSGAAASAGVAGSPLCDRAERGERQRPRKLHDQLCRWEPDGDPGIADDYRGGPEQDLRAEPGVGGTEFTASGLVTGDTVSGVTLTSSGAAASAGSTGPPYAIVPSAAAAAAWATTRSATPMAP